MKNKNFPGKTFLIILICSAFIFTFSSCSKNTEESKNDKQTTEDTFAISQFTESNEDLFTVDFNFFYSELSPSGEWIEMDAKDLGIDIKQKTSAFTDGEVNGLFVDILGIQTANAQTGEDIFKLFVWRPSMELTSNMTKDSKVSEYIPYNNGQWVNTDAGWYFKAEKPQEDLTCHYGRWTQNPKLGYVWLPGKTWSPAWVEWRENADYIAWAPVPPGTYISDNKINVTNSNENRFTIVEKRMFMEPSVYKYRYQYVENKNKIMIKEMTKTDGVMIKNKIVINKGPDVATIEKYSGKKVEQVKIDKVGKKEDSGYKGNIISVYTPEFNKAKEINKEPVSKPKQIVSYKDAKGITKEEQDELKQEDKELKKEEKDIKKQDKELNKEEKKIDKEQKKEEKEIQKEDKKEVKEKNKEEKKQDKYKNSEKDKEKKKDKDDKGKGNKKSEDDDNSKNKNK
jgi:hypothetical protein